VRDKELVSSIYISWDLDDVAESSCKSKERSRFKLRPDANEICLIRSSEDRVKDCQEMILGSLRRIRFLKKFKVASPMWGFLTNSSLVWSNVSSLCHIKLWSCLT
jgi:hypothetical protein